MRKRFLIISVLAAAVTAGFWHFTTTDARTSAAAEIGVTVGKTAPTFSLKTIDGNLVKIGETGKITVLNFWATWCPPCRHEMPELEVFATRHKDDILMAAINLQEPADTVKKYLNQNQYTIPVLLDTDGKAGARSGIRAIPTTLIIDQNGVIRYRMSGAVTADELETVLKELQAKS